MPRERPMVFIGLAALLISWGAVAADGDPDAAGVSLSPHAKLKSIGLRDVNWTSGFWAEKYALCRSAMIPTVQGRSRIRRTPPSSRISVWRRV